MDTITIRIMPFSEGGYYYDIFKGDHLSDDAPEDSDDGGLCTSTMLNALEMAAQQAADLIKRETGEVEDGFCNACAEPMYGLVRSHHHTEEGADATGH